MACCDATPTQRRQLCTTKKTRSLAVAKRPCDCTILQVAESTDPEFSHKEASKQVLVAVHSELADKQRRRRNVIVSGIQPVNGVDDCIIFSSIYVKKTCLSNRMFQVPSANFSEDHVVVTNHNSCE